VALLDPRDDSFGMDLQRREQLYGPVALVVVGPTLDLARAHQEHRLPSIQGLLGLFVRAQHHRVLWRVEVQPNHVHDLGREVGVGGVGEAIRWGFSLCSRRILAPVFRPTPVAWARVRTLQCVSPGGFWLQAVSTTRRRPASAYTRGPGGVDPSGPPTGGGRTALATGQPLTGTKPLPGRSGCSSLPVQPGGSAAPAADGRGQYGSWQAPQASCALPGSTRQRPLCWTCPTVPKLARSWLLTTLTRH